MKEKITFAILFMVGWFIGQTLFTHKPPELTYSQRRDIAIQFVCIDRSWRGAKNFCGSLPPLDSKGDEK